VDETGEDGTEQPDGLDLEAGTEDFGPRFTQYFGPRLYAGDAWFDFDYDDFDPYRSLLPLTEEDSGSSVEDGTEDVLAQVFPNIDVQSFFFHSFYPLVNGNALLG